MSGKRLLNFFPPWFPLHDFLAVFVVQELIFGNCPTPARCPNYQGTAEDIVLGPHYMSRAGPVSRAASMCRDDFQVGITWGEPARLMADAMNHGKPEQAWFCTLIGLTSRAGPANAITWRNLSPVSRDPGTAILGSRLTGLARLSCNYEVDIYCV